MVCNVQSCKSICCRVSSRNTKLRDQPLASPPPSAIGGVLSNTVMFLHETDCKLLPLTLASKCEAIMTAIPSRPLDVLSCTFSPTTAVGTLGAPVSVVCTPAAVSPACVNGNISNLTAAWASQRVAIALVSRNTTRRLVWTESVTVVALD